MIDDHDLIDDKDLNEKICFNALMTERLVRLSTEDKKKVVKHLISVCSISERQIAKKLGVPHTTLNGWKTGKDKDKNGEYVSLEIVIRKLSKFEPKSKKDYDKIKEIHDLTKIMLE